MFELSLVESIAEIGPALYSEFEGTERYPFLNYQWLLALEESGCLGADRGWIPRHVVIRRAKEVVALAPAYIKLNSHGEFVFDQGWAEFSETRLGERYYPKLILAVPFTPAGGARVLMKRGANEKDRELVFDILTGALPELAEKLGLSSVHVLFPNEQDASELESRSWALRLGLQYQFHNHSFKNFDEFLATFRAKKRANIRRERRGLEQQGINLEVTTGTSLRSGDAHLAHSLYLTTVDKHVWGRRYLTRNFFERVMSKMPESIHLVLARDKDGEVIAGAFNLIGSDALYGRYWGAFRDVPFLHFNVCLYEGVHECIKRGLARFEPGAGGEHKQGRGFAPTLTRSLHYLHHPHLDGAVRDFCKKESDAIRAHLRVCANK